MLIVFTAVCVMIRLAYRRNACPDPRQIRSEAGAGGRAAKGVPMMNRGVPSREQVLAALPLEVQCVLADFYSGLLSAGKLVDTLDAAFATARATRHPSTPSASQPPPARSTATARRRTTVVSVRPLAR